MGLVALILRVVNFQFGWSASETPLQMRCWWSERRTNTALPDPTHELAASEVAALELVCVAVGVTTTDRPGGRMRKTRQALVAGG